MPNLLLHPQMTCNVARKIWADAERVDAQLLRCLFRVEGDLAKLCVPPPKQPQRTDFLWQHTCFEAFVQAQDAPAYHELNLSPSGDWAIYGFRNYRDIESIGEDSSALCIAAESTASSLRLEVSVDLQALSPTYRKANLRVGLCAVLEEADGNISYWALQHPPGQADFHHTDSFTVQLSPSLATGI